MTQSQAFGDTTTWAPNRSPTAHTPTVRPALAGPPLARPPLVRRVRDALASAGIRRPRFLRGPRTETPFDAPRIRTDRLVLRAHRMSDADDWFALQSQPEVIEFLPWPERDRRHSARHLKDRTRHTRLWQANDFLALAIEKDGRLIGDVSLHLRSVKSSTRSLEIGWVLHPAYAGAGFATEAADAMLEFAFTVVGAHWVTAVTDPRNIPSVGLAKRLGFVEVGSDATEEVFMLARGARAEATAARRR